MINFFLFENSYSKSPKVRRRRIFSSKSLGMTISDCTCRSYCVCDTKTQENLSGIFFAGASRHQGFFTEPKESRYIFPKARRKNTFTFLELCNGLNGLNSVSRVDSEPAVKEKSSKIKDIPVNREKRKENQKENRPPTVRPKNDAKKTRKKVLKKKEPEKYERRRLDYDLNPTKSELAVKKSKIKSTKQKPKKREVKAKNTETKLDEALKKLVKTVKKIEKKNVEASKKNGSAKSKLDELSAKETEERLAEKSKKSINKQDDRSKDRRRRER